MSFRCEGCGKVPGVQRKPIRVVVETREKIYPVRYAKDGKTVIDKGGKGSEIVREMNLCSFCNQMV